MSPRKLIVCSCSFMNDGRKRYGTSGAPPWSPAFGHAFGRLCPCSCLAMRLVGGSLKTPSNGFLNPHFASCLIKLQLFPCLLLDVSWSIFGQEHGARGPKKDEGVPQSASDSGTFGRPAPCFRLKVHVYVPSGYTVHRPFVPGRLLLQYWVYDP